MGLGRSGTTILLGALGQHPQILSAGGESPFIVDMPIKNRIHPKRQLENTSIALDSSKLVHIFLDLYSKR